MNKDVNEQYVYKIDLLTTELERCSHALQERSIECEDWRLKALGTEARLNESLGEIARNRKDYIDLAENLKQRVVEVEDLRSKLNRIQLITIKDYEDKIERLVQEIQKLNRVVENQVSEYASNRQHTIQKIQELQDERQKIFHLDNHLKQIKNEKLEALHHLQMKTQLAELLQNQLNEAEQYKQQVQTLQLDIETIRSNYTTLYEQHMTDIERYKDQLDTQRQLQENEAKIQQENYIQLVQQQKLEIQKDMKGKFQAIINQLENQVTTLQNLLEAKQTELEVFQVASKNRQTEKQNERELQQASQIRLNQDQIRKLEQALRDKQQQIDQYEKQVSGGNLVYSQNQLILEQQNNALKTQIHKQELEINRLLAKVGELDLQNSAFKNQKIENDKKIKALIIEISQNKELINKIQDKLTQAQQNEKSIIDKEAQTKIDTFKKQISESDQKIKYLLALLDKKESQLLELKNQISPSQGFPKRQFPSSIPRERKSDVSQYSLSVSNMFYHQDDAIFPQEQRQL